MENKHKSIIKQIIKHQSMDRRRRQLPALASERLVVMLALVLLALILLATTTTTTIRTVDAHTLMLDGDHHPPAVNGRSQTGGRMEKPHNGGGGGGGNQNRCQGGWMWFNNKCWVTTQSRRDFAHAVDLCKKQYNSTLPTIHSEEENEFLRQNIELTNSPIWLYARHNHQYNKTHWLDRTIVNYTHWDAGQPSDKSSLICIKTEDSWYMKKAEPVDGQTECVSFWEDAKWGTQVGCQVLLPVVCEKKLTPISRHSDGPNGTIISSQFEQQQMYNPISGSSSVMLAADWSHGIYLLTLLLATWIGCSHREAT